MKKSKFTEEQILFALKQGDAGQPIADVCRQMEISEATYYVWKKRDANMGLMEVRELRQLRDENARLKSLVADLTLDRHVLLGVYAGPASSVACGTRRGTSVPRLATALACGRGCGNLRARGRDLATSASTSCSPGRAGGWVATEFIGCTS